MKPLTGIQALRGYAASLVLLGHAYATGFDKVADTSWLASILRPLFSSGVDVFFVISGFIISRGLLEPMTRPDAIRFAWRRATRIYPLYWIVLGTLATVNLYLPVNVYAMQVSPVPELVFLTTTSNWLIPPAWTLAFEVWFYFVMTCLILLMPRHVPLCMAGWLLLQTVAALLHPGPVLICDHPLVLEFGFGCVLCWMTRNGGHRHFTIDLTLAVVLFTAGALLSRPVWVAGWPRVGTFGLAAFFLVHAIVVASERGVRFPAFLVRLGDASYSIYVSHLGTLIVLAFVSRRIGLTHALPDASRPVLVAGWVAIALTVGLISHQFVERPLLALTRTIARGAGGAARHSI